MLIPVTHFVTLHTVRISIYSSVKTVILSLTDFDNAVKEHTHFIIVTQAWNHRIDHLVRHHSMISMTARPTILP